ncbi:DNA repair protein RecO [candidate division KSB1 bacterium]
MEIRKTQALVLKREKYSESSQVITFLTPDRGRLICIAKGSRRSKSPFGDSLSLYAQAEIIYYFQPYRVLQTVTESDLEWFPWKIRVDPVRFIYASIFAELLLGTVAGQTADRTLFDLVAGGYKTIDRSPSSGLPALLWSLELKLISALGYRPVLEHCVRCGEAVRSGRVSLDPAAGGLICAKHADDSGTALPLSIGSVRLLAGLLDLSLAKSIRHRAGEKMRSEIDSALSAFFEYHLGTAPRLDRLQMVNPVGRPTLPRGSV